MASGAALPLDGQDPHEDTQRLIRAGQVEAALPMAQAWVERQPMHAPAWAQLGQVLVLLKQIHPASQALEKALTLAPDLTTAVIAMAAVCLEQGNDQRAIELLQQGMSDTKLPLAMWLRSANHLVQAMVRCGDRLEQARQCLTKVQSKLLAAGVAVPDWVSSSQWRLAPCWWETREASRLRLRRPLPVDAAWLKKTFSDAHFGDAVNRDYANRLSQTELTQLALQLAHQHRQPPVDQGAVIWLIERHDTVSPTLLGLASFTSIDANNRRAEFIIGFPGSPPAGGLVMEASALLADFAFGMQGACFHKVGVSVYADNPRSADLVRMLQRVGFQQEGVLREQVRLRTGSFVDLLVLGALRSEVLNNQAIQQMVCRYLGHSLI